MEVLFEGRTVPVSLLMDDSIDTVRQRLGAVLERHPDKLFLEVEVELPKDTYENPRDWEAVFFRLAQASNAQATLSELMKSQTTEKRTLAPKIETGIPREDWDSLRSLRFPEGSFREKRILGVEMPQSLVLPVPPIPELAVPSARIPLPQRSRMLKSIHPEKIVRFHATEITAPPNSLIRNTQTPFWTPTTPDRLPEESLRNLVSSLELLRKLRALPVDKPSAVRLTRVRWQIPWIQTDWGVAVRNRFEQIFFGLTVSSKVPQVGLFTNREHGMQHKFQVSDPASQKPDVKIADWMNWVQTTRPQRDRPTLLLQKGTDRTNFERIAITATSMTLNIYRSGQQSTSLEAFQKNMEDWISQLDAVLAFVVPADLKPRRWELSEVSADAAQEDAVTELDTRRMPCLSTLFLGRDANYRLLRADKTDRSLNDTEIAVLRRLRDNENLSASDAAEELQIPLDVATRIVADLTERVREDPSLLTEDLDVMPKLEIASKKIRITHAEDLVRVLEYANILRQVLTGSGEELDAVCPPRSDVMPSETVLVAVAPEIAPELPAEDPDLDDAFGFMGAARPKKVPKDPAANQLVNRLRTQDPDTFDDDYSRKCELKRQPILMTDDDIQKARIKGQDIEEEYPANQRLRISTGVTLCPEQWCMVDRIPLRQDQLVEEQCPECGGDLRKEGSELTIKEAPVLVRDAAFKYPGYLKEVSKKNQQGVPCCYMTPQNTTLAPVAGPSQAMDAFYIMRDTARGIPEKRLAYLSDDLANRLRLSLDTYTKTRKENNRLKDKMQGVFRVGLGRPSKTLAEMLKVNVPRPREAVDALFECPFVKTWRKPGEDDGHFAEALKSRIPDAESRARVGRLLAGVDAAQEGGRLTPLQEIEQVSQATKTQVFRVNLIDATMTCGFAMDLFRGGQRAICILETDSTVDVLAQALHNRKSMDWTVNLQQSPFTRATTRVLETASADACGRAVPSLGDAVDASVKLGGTATFVVDPLGQAQAVWVPGRYILPILPSSPPAAESRKVDQSDIPVEQLPTQDLEREALEKAASEAHPGFAWKRDHQDLQGRRVEVETVSGFRAPVAPQEVPGDHDADEVLATLRQGREEDLVSGLVNEADSKKAAEISQESEVLDYLLFVLSRDMQDEDQAELREAIEEVDANLLEEPLHDWYNAQIGLVDFNKPAEFVRKVRMPCPRYKEEDCKGVCGWTDRGTCRVRADHRKKDDKGRPLLFVRLLKTLVENAKQRAVVLDGRASPFFGRILYLQLPHERFMTDSQIKWEKTQVAE